MDQRSEVEWWVIASQACNIYNPCFQKVPVFELVAAHRIDKCEPQKSRGDNPRALHVEVQAANEIMALELDIQKRWWLPRPLLAECPPPMFRVRDAKPGIDSDWSKNLWLDNFAGWLARSYTRIALPNAFNDAMRDSRIEEVLKEKLTKHQGYAIWNLSVS